MELPHMNGLMLLPNVADGTVTYVTADSVFIVADGIATLWLADVIAMVADGMATGWSVLMLSRQML